MFDRDLVEIRQRPQITKTEEEMSNVVQTEIQVYTKCWDCGMWVN